VAQQVGGEQLTEAQRRQGPLVHRLGGQPRRPPGLGGVVRAGQQRARAQDRAQHHARGHQPDARGQAFAADRQHRRRDQGRRGQQGGRLAGQADGPEADCQPGQVQRPWRAHQAHREQDHQRQHRHREQDGQQVAGGQQVAAEAPPDAPEQGRRPAAPQPPQQREHRPRREEGRQDHLQPEGPLEGEQEQQGGHGMEELVLGVGGERLPRREQRVPRRHPARGARQRHQDGLGRPVEGAQIPVGEGLAPDQGPPEQEQAQRTEQQRRDDAKAARAHRPMVAGC
jgi:hypothetical protein